MVSISIEGRAGKLLGPQWRLHVGTVGEALKALRANAEGIFQKALGFSKAYVLVVDGVPVENAGWASKKVKKSLLFIPVLAGGIISAIYNAIWIALEVYMAAGVAQAIAAVIMVMGIALIAYGMYSLIMAMQDTPKPGEGDGTVSFVFGGPENVASQGGVVPVAYGRMRTGSRVISVASTNVDKAIWESNSLSSAVDGNAYVAGGTPVNSWSSGGGSIGTEFNLR
tara:strand:- start:600 stop:1274 length:675 start_codon:yes stop_codon:yes gene_type:complete